MVAQIWQYSTYYQPVKPSSVEHNRSETRNNLGSLVADAAAVGLSARVDLFKQSGAHTPQTRAFVEQSADDDYKQIYLL